MIRFLFLALCFLAFAYNLFLNSLRRRSEHNPIPDCLKDLYDAEKYETWKNYSHDKTRLELFSITASFLLIAVLLGCNAVNHLCAGIFEASRVGSDTSGMSWEQTRRNGVGAVAFKGIENGTLFAADPDCAGLASAGAIPWEKNSQWIDLLGRSGMPCFVSWRRGLADADVRAKMAEAFARASVPQPTAEPVGWERDPTPEHWKTSTGDMSYDW